MKSKTQSNSSTPNKKDAKTFKAVVSAIEECLAKPPYDYQRIIICHSNRPELGPAVALCSGATLADSEGLAPSARTPSVVVVENAGNWDAKMLQSIVFLVNQTRSVVVVLASVRSVKQWQHRHKEVSAQICRRTHIALEFEI
jgi:hypothetical protein